MAVRGINNNQIIVTFIFNLNTQSIVTISAMLFLLMSQEAKNTDGRRSDFQKHSTKTGKQHQKTPREKNTGAGGEP
jgi:hypothetical protein